MINIFVYLMVCVPNSTDYTYLHAFKHDCVVCVSVYVSPMLAAW